MSDFFASPCGEMVDTLVSGASASRRVGSTPIMGTCKNPYNQLIIRIFYIMSICLDDTEKAGQRPAFSSC